MKFYKNTAYIFIIGSGDEQTPHLALGAAYDNRDRTIAFWFKGRGRTFNIDKVVKDEESTFEFIDTNLLRVSFHPVTLQDLEMYGQGLFGNTPKFKTTEGLQNWLMKNNY